MISRKDWRDAIRASGLPASRRQVLDAMADFWPAATTRPVLWASQAEISARTGLSPATVKRAWRDGEDAGFLVLVERHRQHRAPRYAPTIPPTQTGHPDRSEPVDNDVQTGHPDRSESAVEDPRPVTVHSQTGLGDRRIQKNPEHHHQAPSSTSLTAAALAMVVVEAIPQTLAGTVRRRVLADALGCAADAGWTPELLRAAAHRHDWSHAGAGAVVEWARDIAATPPPAPDAPRVRQLCDVHDVHHTGVCPVCRADQLADPRPLGERLAARAGAG